MKNFNHIQAIQTNIDMCSMMMRGMMMPYASALHICRM